MDSTHQGGNGSNEKSSEQETQSEIVDVNLNNNIAQQVDKLKSKELVLERRVSPRLKSIPQDKKPYYGSDWRKHSVTPEDDNNHRKRELNSLRDNSGNGKKLSKLNHSIRECQPDLDKKDVEDRSSRCESVPIGHAGTEILDLQDGDAEIVELEEDAYLKWTDYEGFLAESILQMANERVEQTMQIFNKYCLHFAQMQNKKEVLYPEKIIGHLPGIAVGHKFNSRSEMVALGFHGHWLNGIDYISKFSGGQKKRDGYTCPLAVSIIMSGEYEDDVDYSNEVVYTGQGGNGNQTKDQVLLRGNLALKNNMEQFVPVRFIRGHSSKPGCRSRKVYTYCGLYKVVNCWTEKGASGCFVYKFRLKRLLGQPKMDIDQVHFGRAGVSNASPRLAGLLCEDISYGEEDRCIPVTNVIDVPPIAPAGKFSYQLMLNDKISKFVEFKYTKSVEVARNITVPPSASGCSCKGNCTNSESCSCAQLNGADFPYVQKNGGRLIEPKDVVYECGPGCGCGPECINRVSQRKLKYRLEVYRTENKGWAVRSWDAIPSGAPVCEYTGLLRRNDELDNVSENDYIFDIDCWHTMKGIGGRERRQGDVTLPTSDLADKEDDNLAESESEFCIDAGSCGNVARFINHSCRPNLFVQCVLSSHHDIRLARVVLFAADDIPPMQELTYDYGYVLDSVIGPDGEIKQAPCFCGADECRGRLY
ncbi:hypothetical protein JCGZ_06559 [Jatropha curcas]|uniref:Histone-lysine N-methyltransferase n=1 Tax=Jatropha curcas TaxID=180498 RepID=A0A067LE93_JATCU|nr:hypothetical protein JCGZ_06559 [Jatropha curcas]